jgi:hypothetical protein
MVSAMLLIQWVPDGEDLNGEGSSLRIAMILGCSFTYELVMETS